MADINAKAILNLMSKLPPESLHAALVELDCVCSRVLEGSLIKLVDNYGPDEMASVQEELGE